MYYIYLLRSKRDNRIYTGYTENLKRRIQEHFNKHVHSTLRMGSLELVYYEGYKSKDDAIGREKYLKTTKGKRAIRLMLNNTFKASII